YKADYKIQTPFRQWKAAYDGTIKVTSELENSGKNTTAAYVYKNNSENYESDLKAEVSAGKKHDGKSTDIKISKDDNLYFITKTEEPIGSDVNYNIKIEYTDLKAYVPLMPAPEFFPEPKLSVPSADDVLPEEISSLYRPVDSKNYAIRDDWKKYADRAAYGYLIDRKKFIPGAFTEAQFDRILESIKSNIKAIQKSDIYQKEYSGKKDFYQKFASYFIHDITGKVYIIRDDCKKTVFDVFSSHIPSDLWSNYDRHGISAIYDGENFFYGQKSEEEKTGETRSPKSGGTQIKNGNLIILGKYDGKILSAAKDGKVFLDEDELTGFSAEFVKPEKKDDENNAGNDVEKDDEEEDRLTVILTHEYDNEKIAYEFGDFLEAAWNLSKDEMQLIVDDYYIKGESLDDELWNWTEKEESPALRTLKSYGMDDEQQSAFLKTVYDKSEKEIKEDEESGTTEKTTVYTKKQNLTSGERTAASKILAEIKFRRVLEEEFDYYQEDENQYKLKDSYKSELFRTKNPDSYKILVKKCSEHGFGKYCSVQVSTAYDPDALYKLNEEGRFESLRLAGTSTAVEKNYFSPGQTKWNSEEAWKNKLLEEEKVLYSYPVVKKQETGALREESKADVKPIEVTENIQTERAEKLFAGEPNWFFGIWIDEIPFTGNEIEKILTPDSTGTDYEKKKTELENVETNDQAKLKAQKENVEKNPFYAPVCNNKDFSGTNGIYPVAKEAGSGKDGLENSLVGLISMNTRKSGSVMVTDYYFPYIAGDFIHACRAGGNAFYSIEGVMDAINGSSASPSSFVFPNVRMSRSKGEDETFGMNLDFNYSGPEVLENVEKLGDCLKKAGGSLSFGGNTGTNTTTGNVTQTVMDLNGDSIPDIIQSNDSGSTVIPGRKSGGQISFCEGYSIGIKDINSTRASMKVEGASFSPSGSVSYEFSKNGQPKAVRTSASTNGGAGGTKTEGDSYTSSGFIDLNGDGLPDYFNGDSISLNKGDDFEDISSRELMSADGYINHSEMKSYSANVSVGKSSTKGESITTGASVGTGLSYSVSSNKTSEMLLDINGDGLADKLVQDTGCISVYYNTGNSFVKTYDIALPSWNLTGSEKISLTTGKDVNFDLGLFGQIPLIGSLTTGLVNLLPVCNPFAGEEIDNMDFSSTISLSLSGNLGLNFTFLVKIPIAGISINITCSGGNAVSGSSSINAVNVSLTDLDGDGLSDHVLRIPGTATYWKRNISGQYGLLRKVNTPQGGYVSIAYKGIYGTVDNPNFKYVMSKVCVSDGADGSGAISQRIEQGEHSVTTLYSYDSAYYDRAMKDFYGFKTVKTQIVEKINYVGNPPEEEYVPYAAHTVDTYRNDCYYLKGALVQSVTWADDSNSKKLSESKTEYRNAPYAQPVKEVSTTCEDGGEITTSTYYEYKDDYGNCTDVVQDFGDGKKLTAKISYDAIMDKYIVALPYSIEVFDTNNVLIRKREGRYHT
ncbi:MAG: hypothetical protein J6Y93_01300, partial [Treponema sp.]|nr:hypothetical protein [Treponema sp.]